MPDSSPPGMAPIRSNPPGRDPAAADEPAVLRAFAAEHGLGSVAELLRYPKYIEIEITSVCNAHCIMCPTNLERDHAAMPQAIFDRVVDDLAPHADWIERVTLPVLGEPLLDKRLEAWVATLKGIGIKSVMINSNASLMTEKRAEALLEAGVDCVDFSLDGATRETFEGIRTRLKFDRCVANIETFLKTRARLGHDVPVRVRMTVFDDNAGEFDDFVAFWRQRLGPGDDAYGKYLHHWAQGVASSAAEGFAHREEMNATPCISPWGSLCIFSDGRVPLCCHYFNGEITLGNVTEAPIREIWQGAIISAVREGHWRDGRNAVETCVDCIAWDPAAHVPTGG